MEHSPVEFFLDGSKIYWSPIVVDTKPRGEIRVIHKNKNSWSTPQIAPFSGKFDDYNPVFDFASKAGIDIKKYEYINE